MLSSLVVLGGGFRGLVASFLLAKKGHPVTLVERSPFCGGVLQSPEWNGLYCDLGCQLFDNTDREHTSVLTEMVGGQDAFHSVDLKYASLTGDNTVTDISVVDLSHAYSRYGSIWLEQLNNSSAKRSEVLGPSLDDALEERYGHHISLTLRPIVKKAYATHPCNIDRVAIKQGLFSRIRIADDETSMMLKRDPYLDQVLAASNLNNPTLNYPQMSKAFGRNFYPSAGGLSSFVEKTVSTLKALGVRIINDDAIESIEPLAKTDHTVRVRTLAGFELIADNVISTLPTVFNASLLLGGKAAGNHRGVPMLVCYVLVPFDAIQALTYVHDFHPDHLVFRASTPGRYGKQVNSNGHSYLCAECPTTLDSEAFQAKPEELVNRVWNEIKSLGIVDPNALPVDWKILKVKRSFSVPELGAPQKDAELKDEMEAKFPRFIHFNSFSYSKSHIITEALDLVESVR